SFGAQLLANAQEAAKKNKVASTTIKDVDGQIPNYPNLPPQLISQLHNVTMHVFPNSIAAYGEPNLQFFPLPRSDEKHHASSPPSVLERCGNDEIYDQLEQALTEAENAKRKGFEESKRPKLQKHHSFELRRRREVEEELAMGKEELKFMRNQRDKIYEDLQNALTQKSSLENELEQSSLQIKELEEKMLSVVDLLQQYKDREELQVERDNALREAVELREQLENQPSISNTRQYFATFSLLELEEATDGFNLY
ncbi:hypothetical protein Droror1_Dr00026568, partial [Drosera rotundifolia]